MKGRMYGGDAVTRLHRGEGAGGAATPGAGGVNIRVRLSGKQWRKGRMLKRSSGRSRRSRWRQ